MCPFTVRVPLWLCLADFLGSLITCTITSSRGNLYTIRFQLGRWICRPSSQSIPFNRLFRQTAALSLLRLHITHKGSNGILTVSAIDLAVRLSLRTRLTLIRLALIRKPWSCGGRVTLPPYRYLCLHLLFHKLHQSLRIGFDVDGMLPYHSVESIASAIHLMPVYYPRTTARLVSCYALFK